MEKRTKTFENGETTRYNFANGNNISISCIKNEQGWIGNLYWQFGKYKNPIFGVPILTNYHKTKNRAKIYETTELYNSIKKYKNKSNDKKLLLNALIIVIHEIKNEIFVEQKLF